MTKRSIPPVMAGGIGQKGTWTLHLISYPVSASSHPVSAGRLLITERNPSPNQAAACAKAIVSLCSKPPMVVKRGRRLHIRSCKATLFYNGRRLVLGINSAPMIIPATRPPMWSQIPILPLFEKPNHRLSPNQKSQLVIAPVPFLPSAWRFTT